MDLHLITLHEMPSGDRLGDIVDFGEAKLNRSLSVSATLLFDVSAHHPLSEELVGAGWNPYTNAYALPRRAVAMWRRLPDPNLPPHEWPLALLFCGGILLRHRSYGSDADGPRIAISAQDAWYYAQRRVADPAGDRSGYSPDGVRDTGDRTELVGKAIRETSARGWAFLRADPADATPAGVITIADETPGLMISEFNDHLSAGASGYEWILDPVAFEDGDGGPVMGAFRAAPTLGTDRSGGEAPVLFSFGGPAANCESVDIIDDFSRAANSITHIAPDTAQFDVHAEDGASIAANGLLEDVAAAELTDEGLRREWVRSQVALRAFGHQEVLVQPAPSHTTGMPYQGPLLPDGSRLGDFRVPRPLIDYEPGDFVRVECWDQGVRLETFAIRVWGVEITVNEDREERVELGLAA